MSPRLAIDVLPPPVMAEPPEQSAFLADCLAGLSKPQKTLPSKWLYDEAGSFLFDRICDQPEYYPFRIETALIAMAAPSLAHEIAYGAQLIELGSGASRKTRLLLDALPNIAVYRPIDINPVELARSAAAIRRDYLGLSVRPVVADFTDLASLDLSDDGSPRLAFFPGSTLGNLDPADAVDLLAAIRQLVGPGGRLLLGIDMMKDEATLIPAYDDAAGITAAFNLNLLERINRDLGSDVDVASFRHNARWNAAERRIEMHLVAQRASSFTIANVTFRIAAGETIHTENSHKWAEDQLEAMFYAAGWRNGSRWMNAEPSFLLALLDA